MRKTISALALLSAACSSNVAPAQPARQQASAVFAGGCFWCTEADFDKMPGVLSTTSGYTGGRSANPTYKQVTAGGTGHIEAVRVVYDPTRISYADLVRRFLPTIDVTDGGGQFCDRGESYRPAIFVANAEQRRSAQAALDSAGQRLKQPLAVAVLPASRFWAAEGYHQDYYKKNPARYKFYRWNCGRDQRLKALWG
ncbi:MAG TPA: peptide-methionine (S)-S-oxide reductase MsrA [Sphingomicrobium sp.]|nr:peptide-methionine (S)-S-oxide reductase MsrA [Sphingomicrobium sp.]